jgi:polyisoprenoid-binding protein YceI
MRKLGYLPAFILLAVLLAPSLTAAEWRIDPAHSAAQFAVKHMMVSTVRGDFGTMSGTVSYDPENPTAAKVMAEVDVASIETRNERRNDHLRSADFFDVANYPTMTFESTKVEKVGDGLKMTGNLTIHGVTREVTFDVEGPAPPIKTERGMRTGASATTKISRKDFGMTWNRAIEAGGLTVGDEVTITIDIEMTSGN